MQESELSSMGIYRTEELDWRTFIPPLPEHKVDFSSVSSNVINFFSRNVLVYGGER